MTSKEVRDFIVRLECYRASMVDDPWLDADLQLAAGALTRLALKMEEKDG